MEKVVLSNTRVVATIDGSADPKVGTIQTLEFQTDTQAGLTVNGASLKLGATVFLAYPNGSEL
jgi:hypothetical protein